MSGQDSKNSFAEKLLADNSTDSSANQFLTPADLASAFDNPKSAYFGASPGNLTSFGAADSIQKVQNVADFYAPAVGVGAPPPAAVALEHGLAAQHVYHADTDPNGLRLQGTGLELIHRSLETLPNSADSGFKAAAYRNAAGDILVSVAGTDDLKDLAPSGLQATTDVEPAQYQQGRAFLDKIIAEHPDANITLTGHSLGGSIATCAALEKNLDAIVFNSPGVRHSVKDRTPIEAQNKIINIHTKNDPIDNIRLATEAHGATRPLGKYYQINNSPGGSPVGPLHRHSIDNVVDSLKRIVSGEDRSGITPYVKNERAANAIAKDFETFSELEDACTSPASPLVAMGGVMVKRGVVDLVEDVREAGGVLPLLEKTANEGVAAGKAVVTLTGVLFSKLTDWIKPW